MCTRHNIRKNPLVFIAAVMLVNAYSFSTLAHHLEKRAADDRFVSSALHYRSRAVFPHVLGRLLH